MKKILFLTGTRADFGKLKSLIAILQEQTKIEPYLFVTGMHMQELYGYTLIEVQKSGFKNIHTFKNHTHETTMDLTLAKTIEGFSSYVNQLQPDLIIIHGDRVEALAGAIVGSLNNILVAHIEGGELSGTIDELIRHSTSKLSHIHFVSNDEARKRLIQMGELNRSVYTIGSPDVDIMFSNQLPSLDEAKKYYEITFAEYAIAMFHPVTTEIKEIGKYAHNFVNGLLESGLNYIVVYPNNDLGSRQILDSYNNFKNNPKFKVFPSLRFEYFLMFLKHAKFIIGNSSAGIREAPLYGVPTINIGTRQENRSLHAHIVNTSYEKADILAGIQNLPENLSKDHYVFGEGNSAEKFIKCLLNDDFWKVNHQKQFKDV